MSEPNIGAEMEIKILVRANGELDVSIDGMPYEQTNYEDKVLAFNRAAKAQRGISDFLVRGSFDLMPCQSGQA